jgi:F-type H+-transporting ATPase subunit b
LLTAAAEGGGHPLIDIDLTVLIQLVVFAAMGFLASRLLFRPYLAMRDERAAGIEGARAEAERMQAQAEAQLADYQAELQGARQRATEERRRLQAEATEYERQVLGRTRAEATSALTEAQQTIDRETATARAELAPRATEIARAVAGKLLGREVVQ